MKSSILIAAASLVWLSGCILVPESTGAIVSTDAALDEPELDRRGDAWKACLSRSFAAQRSMSRDRDMAAELAFQACSTEERAALEYTVAKSDLKDPVLLNQLIADGKAKLKADLVARR